MKLYNVSVTFYNNKPPMELTLLLKDDKDLQEYHNKYIYKMEDVMLTMTTEVSC